MTTPLLTERHGPVTLLTLSAPMLRNALSDAMMLALADALREADADPAVCCVVLTGDPAGKAFSSGGNLREMTEGASRMFDPAPVVAQEGYRSLVQQIPLAFEAIDVPVIAAVNGPAIGAGLDITTMCDIRLASPAARFAESFVKVGLVSGDGGAWFLQRAIGYGRAIELALTAEMFDADQAQAIGLVSRVVPAEELVPEALALGARIAANPREAVRLTKRLFRHGRSATLQQSLDHGAALQAIAQTTADHREAVAAMLEKRPPRLTGR
ncbi:enoyl-CoA hydratase-related protein [Novosphingobium album (ex Liu et al. 2023)]|uniref:Enoyl-CoA hydratase-related protein n=1 Tax=Novosphingobium album (ex Liu et al. 2023) TaxID=3031130 RepID=A0ABT5WX80_9SPHN|nr:enoyl-CoA hydratase-related protein [Novosphingobium album (ex Liu et al. 2023)]MDE8654510.1 enoyl-CoA hydratase-related protein [Novosphingobium album (ex Liu et al. 2023)]